MKEEPNSDLFRRRELYDARCREVKKNIGSRRRTLASSSPINLGSDEFLLKYEQKEQETVTNQKHKIAETGTQGDQEKPISWIQHQKGARYLPIAQPGGARINKDSIKKNEHSKSEQRNDDLGITDTASQRSEALREARSTTKRYDDQQLMASVMTKTKEQVTRKGISPNNKLDWERYTQQCLRWAK